jgi:hypothetical protein
VTTVPNGHVRGLTPEMSERDRANALDPPGNPRSKAAAVKNGHVRGLTPDMSGRDA